MQNPDRLDGHSDLKTLMKYENAREEALINTFNDLTAVAICLSRNLMAPSAPFFYNCIFLILTFNLSPKPLLGILRVVHRNYSLEIPNDIKV